MEDCLTIWEDRGREQGAKEEFFMIMIDFGVRIYEDRWIRFEEVGKEEKSYRECGKTRTHVKKKKICGEKEKG